MRPKEAQELLSEITLGLPKALTKPTSRKPHQYSRNCPKLVRTLRMMGLLISHRILRMVRQSGSYAQSPGNGKTSQVRISTARRGIPLWLVL